MKIVVMGAGVCGLAAALALSRDDHEVTILERDAPPPPGDSHSAPDWQRPGIPHFLQPHAFLGHGVKELRNRARDVYASLLDAGADEVRLFEKMPDARSVPSDQELIFLGCRRPVIEWVLRNNVAKEPNISLCSAAPALGLAWEQEGSVIPRATGVLTSEGAVDADLVVDAMGRSSPLSEWIVDGGGLAPEETSDNCGIVYFSRYFRFRGDHHRPDGPWVIAPRAELGNLETGMFWGDNDTFALVQMIRAEDRHLRILRHADQYMTSLRAQLALDQFTSDEVAGPITQVLPMGQLRNTFKQFVTDDHPIASGVIALGDSRCNTNPRYAWGLSIALNQAWLLADLVREHGNEPDDLSLAFEDAATPWATAAYQVAKATDDERKRYWGGEPLDLLSPKDAPQLF
jgi:2-polyprenyl-6-methoxyphenol hydroxylase-like FAD-dependent oxidoreductase